MSTPSWSASVEWNALVNNAGLNRDGPFLRMADDDWDRVIATNLTGVFICAQEFARRFAER